ncbi:hypothetical protein PLICRDRAFT_26895 [Plicaturopsis crispa FD-325 SS-3]|nr:hypothetical protein PLICRDRAFT_26895 [Plicaturopsis crispa FD-325 SS-3]
MSYPSTVGRYRIMLPKSDSIIDKAGRGGGGDPGRNVGLVLLLNVPRDGQARLHKPGPHICEGPRLYLGTSDSYSDPFMELVVADAISPIELTLYALGDSGPGYTSFFHHWPPDAILRFGRVSRRTRYITLWVRRKFWNIETLLTPWVRSPTGLLREMLISDAVIGGLVALQFFDRVVDERAVLDIYSSEMGIRGLGQYLIRDGYRFLGVMPDSTFDASVERMLWEPTIRSEMNSVRDSAITAYPFSFSKIASYHHPNSLPRFQKVRLMLVCGSPIKFVTQTNSTAMMNCLLGDRAISLYPRTTFMDRVSVRCNKTAEDTAHVPHVVEKYTGPPLEAGTSAKIQRREIEVHRSIADQASFLVDTTIFRCLPVHAQLQ